MKPVLVNLAKNSTFTGGRTWLELVFGSSEVHFLLTFFA